MLHVWVLYMNTGQFFTYSTQNICSVFFFILPVLPSFETTQRTTTMASAKKAAKRNITQQAKKEKLLGINPDRKLRSSVIVTPANKGEIKMEKKSIPRSEQNRVSKMPY